MQDAAGRATLAREMGVLGLTATLDTLKPIPVTAATSTVRRHS